MVSHDDDDDDDDDDDNDNNDGNDNSIKTERVNSLNLTRTVIVATSLRLTWFKSHEAVLAVRALSRRDRVSSLGLTSYHLNVYDTRPCYPL